MSRDALNQRAKVNYDRRMGERHCIDCHTPLGRVNRNTKRCDGCRKAYEKARWQRYYNANRAKMVARVIEYRKDKPQTREAVSRYNKASYYRKWDENRAKYRAANRTRWESRVLKQESDPLLREMRRLLLMLRRLTWARSLKKTKTGAWWTKDSRPSSTT